MELGLSLGLGFTAAVNERLGRQEDGQEPEKSHRVASSFRAIDFSIFKRNRNGAAVDDGRASDAAANGGASEPASRASDEDENGVNARKKLRLSKEQSAYLEESFKEHHTLNPVSTT
nr:homeobox-leucine zipper protein HOX11-like [Ipomoea trifida]